MPKYTTERDTEKSARAFGYELHCSPKDSMNLAYALRGMTLEKAKKYLEDVAALKRPVPTIFHKKKAKHLIVDLRGNPGGSNTFSDPMVAYFASRPFSFCSKFTVRTSQNTKESWKDISDSTLLELRTQILSHENGSRFEVSIPQYQPRKDSLRFGGKVYVLINRYTYSNATVTAAMIQDYGFGKLVGEATVDAPTVYGSIQNFRLPNTQMLVSYPKAFAIRPNGDSSFHGVVPDYQVKESILTDKDEILEYTLQLIREDEDQGGL